MNADYLQRLRFKLQKRVRRLCGVQLNFFHPSLQAFWKFLRASPLLVGVLDDLERRRPDIAQHADAVMKGQSLLFTEEEENAALACFVIRKCAESAEQMPEVHAGIGYARGGSDRKPLDAFKDVFLEGLYEYIDEQLDEQRAVLGLLRRYQSRSEWFRRSALHALWEGDTRRGENRLAMDLYEYLHDQGIEFAVEPSSVSGRADLTVDPAGDEPLVADVKIFDPGRDHGVGYIAKGCQQVYAYAVDHARSVAYLVIFCTSPAQLRVALPAQAGTPYFVHNGRTVYFVIIDIYPDQVSASKRGTLQIQDLTEADLVRIVSSPGLGEGSPPPGLVSEAT